MNKKENKPNREDKYHKKNYRVLFTIEERGGFKVLINDKQVICGIFRSYKEAAAAIKIHRAKIISKRRWADIKADQEAGILPLPKKLL